MSAPVNTVLPHQREVWQRSVLDALRTRNARETRSTPLITQHNYWMREAQRLKAENAQLAASQRALTAAAATATSGGSAVDSAKTSEELAQSVKMNADLVRQVMELTERMSRESAQHEQRRVEVAELKAVLERTQTRLQRLSVEHEEQSATVTLVRHELEALQAVLAGTEERVKALTKENATLLDRWMKKAEEDSGRMNEANKFFSEVKQQEKLLQQRAHSSDAAPERRASASASTGAGGGTRQLSLDDFHVTEVAALKTGASVAPTTLRRAYEASAMELNAVTYSANAAMIVTAGSDKCIKVWDANSGAMRAQLMGVDKSVMSVRVSHDHELVLAASNDNAARIWSLELGRVRHSLLGHLSKVYSADLSYDSQKAVTGSHDRTLKLWDLSKGYCIRTLFCYSSCNDAAMSRDAAFVVSGHLDNLVRFFDLRSGELIKELSGIHAGQVTSVCVAQDGTSVLTNSRDNTLRLVDVRTYETLLTLRHDAYKNGLNHTRATLSPDGRFVCAGSQDGAVCVWDTLKAGALVDKPLTRPSAATVTCVAWSPNGNQLAAVDRAGQLSLWG